MAAQNQHYVPKFILRQFLSDEANERVTVYDKHTGKTFVTSIRNVMAERRFNDFTFDDEWIVSFEPIACAAEEHIFPAYQKVIEERRLDGTPEQKAALAMLAAFQFMRTKASRDRWQSLEDALREKIEAEGGRMQDIQGWENWAPSTEDDLKREHLTFLREHLGGFANIIAQKDFLLAEPAPNRSFYLGDNPVSLNNLRDFGPYGNLGLGVPGIEIYLPLASDLMLCAWCPSILEEIRKGQTSGKLARRGEVLSEVLAGRMTVTEMKDVIDQVIPLEGRVDVLLHRADDGRPMDSDDSNMDYYNSLQVSFAYRYVICRSGDFDLAKRYNEEFPKFRTGRRPAFA